MLHRTAQFYYRVRSHEMFRVSMGYLTLTLTFTLEGTIRYSGFSRLDIRLCDQLTFSCD